MKIYPKVLIINSYGFNDYSGGGITLKNLFFGWPLDKIALAHWDNSEPMENVCLKYYRFGYEDHHYIFPLNYISNEPRDGLSGPYTAKTKKKSNPASITTISESPKPTSLFKRLFLSGLDKSGLADYLHPLRLTDSFKEWVLDFKPDIIYSQFGAMAFTDLVLKIQRITDAKVVVHIMDDWPSTLYKDKFFGSILRILIHQKFTKNLKIASLRLGISEAMALEYEKRYKLSFKYFHNPVNCKDFHNVQVNRNDGHYLIVYSGRIGIASHDSIIEFAKCVQELRLEGHKITFKIYTDLKCTDLVSDSFKFSGTFLLPALMDKDFVEKLTEADLLLYPVDFSAESIQYIRLSFPTKLPSYLSSGVPVFCYGPSNVHSIEYMADKNLGFVCNQQNINILKEKLLTSLSDNISKMSFAESARQYAYNHFEKGKVRELFHGELINVMTKN